VWRWPALLAVFLDPGFVLGLGSDGAWTVLAVSLDFAAHLLVSPLSFAVVLAGKDVGVVVVDCLLGDAEFEW
jgi:hypothetical protein